MSAIQTPSQTVDPDTQGITEDSNYPNHSPVREQTEAERKIDSLTRDLQEMQRNYQKLLKWLTEKGHRDVPGRPTYR
jgi:hypothetical protein